MVNCCQKLEISVFYMKQETITIRPNSTIEALLRFYNDHIIDKQQLQYLLAEFNRANPHACPPKPGMIVDIPILKEYGLE